MTELARRFDFKAMGSPCVLHLYPAAGVRVEEVADHCIADAGRLEVKYSRYRDDSVTTAINRSAGSTTGYLVDSETACLLDYADTAYQQSDGLFDITSGILRTAWDFKSNRLPDPQVLEAACRRIGWHRVGWSSGRLVLPAGMELDFGGLVKEYTVDRLAERCREFGIEHGLVDLGGDVRVIGPHPDGRPWVVGIRNPRAPEVAMSKISLVEGGLASSGDYERFMIVDGVRYCHILDPRSGWPVQGLSSVSVFASHCLIAGTATTIAMLKGQRDGIRWLDELGLPNLRMDREGRASGTLSGRTAPACAGGAVSSHGAL